MASMGSSCKMRKMVAVLVSILGMSMMMMTNCTEETCEVVLDRNGEKILYGSENPFVLYDVDSQDSYPYTFFGLGYPGDPVHTNSGVTMGPSIHHPDPDAYMTACQADGSFQTVPLTPANLPLGVIRVLHNATEDSFYRLAITDTPNRFLGIVQIGSYTALGCMPVGQSAHRFQFENPTTIPRTSM